MSDRISALRNAFAIVLAGVLIGGVGALFLTTLQLVDTTRLSLSDVGVKSSIPGRAARSIDPRGRPRRLPG